MAGLAVSLIVGGRRLLRVSRVEPGPTPAVAPKLVPLEAANSVFYHDEPPSKGTGTAYGSRCHGFGSGIEHFLHKNGAFGKLTVLAKRSDGSGLRFVLVLFLSSWALPLRPPP